MPTTRFTVRMMGREMVLEGPNAVEMAEDLAERGATIYAETVSEDDRYGVPLNRLNDDQLRNLEEIADGEDWDRLKHEIREERQQLLL